MYEGMLALDDGSVCFSSSEGGHTLTSAGGESVSHYYAISCYNPGDKLPHFLGSVAGMPGGMIDIGGGQTVESNRITGASGRVLYDYNNDQFIVSLSPDKNPENASFAVFSRNGDFVEYLMPNDNEDYYVDPTNGKSWSIMTPQKIGHLGMTGTYILAIARI